MDRKIFLYGTGRRLNPLYYYYYDWMTQHLYTNSHEVFAR